MLEKDIAKLMETSINKLRDIPGRNGFISRATAPDIAAYNQIQKLIYLIYHKKLYYNIYRIN